MSLLTEMPDFTKELTIIINEDDLEHSTRFTVPEDLIVEHSRLFKAACRHEWTEASSRIVKLPDVHADVFPYYLYWVHRKQLSVD